MLTNKNFLHNDNYGVMLILGLFSLLFCIVTIAMIFWKQTQN